ncbi:DUF6286 domain-containing Asp23/Gls24 family envelope stress response protein [Streptomyces sp. NPDC092369]|uniref:DUF6286 domain-containing Asp23/Gls24 family envelope stress response protein n=1 Tax=Streptomyces sp. NPDC092369 TaxID=3366015 RepID=UPI0038228BB1
MITPAQRGTTTVSDKAVRRIAERAAVEALPDRGASTSKGAVSVHGRRADVALDVTVSYPRALPEAVRRLQEHVASRTGQLTGLDVTRPRIGVTALSASKTVDTTADREEVPEAAAGDRTPLRWWSQRRLPMALLTLAIALAAGALASDLILVHTAHRPAAAWRTGAVHWLAHHGPGDTSVAVAAGAIAVLGALMIVLALSPGRRGLLPIASAPRVRAAVDRSTIAALVRDAVGATAGIGRVRVRVRRRRVAVRTSLAFGDRTAARHEVTAAAQRVIDGCELRRAPRLSVSVRPEDTWDPEPDVRSGTDESPPATESTGSVPDLPDVPGMPRVPEGAKL